MPFFSWYIESVDRASDEFTNTEDEAGSQVTSKRNFSLDANSFFFGDASLVMFELLQRSTRTTQSRIPYFSKSAFRTVGQSGTKI